MCSRVYEEILCPSVCPSVYLSHSPTAAACSRLAAVGPADRRYLSIAAWPAPQHHSATVRHTEANADSDTFSAYVDS